MTNGYYINAHRGWLVGGVDGGMRNGCLKITIYSVSYKTNYQLCLYNNYLLFMQVHIKQFKYEFSNMPSSLNYLYIYFVQSQLKSFADNF